MPRPTTKPDLIHAANDHFEKMWTLIDSLTDAEQNADFQFGDLSDRKEAHWTRDKNLRDVLIHLHEWHRLLLNCVAANQGGVASPFLPEPYNWKTYGDMNVAFWSKHQGTPYGESRELMRESHSSIVALIESLSNDALFAKGAYAWTGSSTLGSYCVSVTASHYDWAMRKIKLHIKTIRRSS